MPTSTRRFLVMVRAGEKSLHRNWLAAGERTWDLVVSWYGAAPYVPVADERVLPARGWKWDILARQLVDHPELVENYDYVWLPDDDLDVDAARIDRLFDISERFGLAVSQPGLSPDSYFSYIHTLRCPSFLLRYTDYVECMAPCFSRATLQKALPHFAIAPSGWGIDHTWARLSEDNRCRAAVIDAAWVHHTRPIGADLARRMGEAGQSQGSEGEAALARFGIGWAGRRFHCYAGIGRTGRRRGRVATALFMFIDHLRNMRHWVQKRAWRPFIRTFTFVHRPAQLAQVHDRMPRPAAEAARR